MFSGFEQRLGWANGDGGGDHARANATILTGARPKKTAGSDIRLGISVDQFAAQHAGDETRFSSLELSCDGVRKSGACDSGYSCAYQFNISWRSETSPVSPESNPRPVFERLFGSGKGAERQKNFEMRQARQKSILDFVMTDANSLERQLGRNDQNKLDEYLTGVREMEKRIQKAERFGHLPDPGASICRRRGRTGFFACFSVRPISLPRFHTVSLFGHTPTSQARITRSATITGDTVASAIGADYRVHGVCAPRNRSNRPENRSLVRLFLTAKPRAFFCPTSTTIFLPRVMAV
jgi:hypothetical protein